MNRMQDAPRDGSKIQIRFGDQLLIGYWGRVAYRRGMEDDGSGGHYEYGWRTPSKNFRASEADEWMPLSEALVP